MAIGHLLVGKRSSTDFAK